MRGTLLSTRMPMTTMTMNTSIMVMPRVFRTVIKSSLRAVANLETKLTEIAGCRPWDEWPI